MRPIEMPGDVFAPGADMAEAKRRADTADEMSGRPCGQRWRPTSDRVVLVDNRLRDPEAPVLLKTSVFGSDIVTEWRQHSSLDTACYHVFDVDRFESERTFELDQVAAALTYHAELEAAARRREWAQSRAVARALRFWQPAFVAALDDEPHDEHEADPWEEATRVAEGDHACFRRERG